MSVRPLKENDGVESTIHKGSDHGQHLCCWSILYMSERLTKTECICFSQLLDSGKLCPFCIAYVLGFNDPFQTKTTRRNNKVIRYSNMHYGQVEHFIIVETQCPPRYAGSFSKYLLCAIVNVIIIVAGMADVTRSTSHMHMVPLQSTTGKLAVVPLQDKCDVCVSANVHEDLHHICAAKQNLKSRASRFGVSCKTTHVEVLLLMFLIIYILSK